MKATDESIPQTDSAQVLRAPGGDLEAAVLAVCNAFWSVREFGVNNPPRRAMCYEHWNDRQNRYAWLLDKLEEDVDALARLVWGEDCDRLAPEPMTGDYTRCEAEQAEVWGGLRLAPFFFPCRSRTNSRLWRLHWFDC